MVTAVLLCCSLLNDKSETPVQQARSLFVKSYSSPSNCYEFYNVLKSVNHENNITLVGYKAISEIMLCKHVLNPFTKLNHFNKGKALLEESIHLAPDNVELRFLRYSVQKNAPLLLQYRNNLKEDKAVIDQWLSQEAHRDPELRDWIIACMRQYKTASL
jgi:hypothetical protein